MVRVRFCHIVVPVRRGQFRSVRENLTAATGAEPLWGGAPSAMRARRLGMSIARRSAEMNMKFTRILVATDFSLDADAGLAYALALAKSIPASVHVLHVVENPLAAGVWSSDLYTSEIAGLQINLVRDAEKRLRAGIRSLDHPGVKLTTEVRTGRAGSTIVECARDRESDLVVIGTHGRTGLAHLVMGSVAEHVVRHAPCPVLVIRPIEHPAQAASAAS